MTIQKFVQQHKDNRMSRFQNAAYGSIAMFALTGCVEDTGGSEMPTASDSPPFIEGTFGASEAAVAACTQKLSAETTGGVRVVGSEFSQANSAVYMRVGDNGAPWRCLVSDDGSNPSVMFMGSEGTA